MQARSSGSWTGPRQRKRAFSRSPLDTWRNPKPQIPNPKQISMNQDQNPKPKPYDLEERTYQFAKRVRKFVKLLPRTVCNFEHVKQLIKASGSVGANYIEANEALGKKDFLMR